MHLVARVSIKYWKTSVRNTVFFSDRFYILFTKLRQFPLAAEVHIFVH
jgi:hypothetical protein